MSTFEQSQLPEPTPMPTVTMTIAEVRDFRDDYEILVRFAAAVTGLDEHELTPIDLDKWRKDHGLPHDARWDELIDLAREGRI
jgi:hypothetical protein